MAIKNSGHNSCEETLNESGINDLVNWMGIHEPTNNTPPDM